MIRPEFRRARREDFPEILHVWYETEVEGEADPPPPPADGKAFSHDLETGDLFLGEWGGRVAGFGSSVVRGRVRFLANLFVRPAAQSQGIGRRLLELCMPEDGRIHCTLSSSDPRAQALYVRRGMRPLWPNLALLLEGPAALARPEDVQVVEAEPDHPDLLAMDADIGGRDRPVDHAHWTADLRAVPVWFERGGSRLGYGYVQRRRPVSLRHADGVKVGPLGVREARDAPACVVAAVLMASGLAPSVAIDLPGPHPALPLLLAAGFRIEGVDLFHRSGDQEFCDPTRYVGSGGELF